MITTSDTFVIEDSNKTRFAGASIYSKPRLFDDSSTVLVDVAILDSSSIVDTGILATILLEFTYSELTAFTSSGANDVEKYFNLVEQAVKDYLDGLTDNSGATFTIA